MNEDQGKGDRAGHEPLGRAPFAASVRKRSSRQLEAWVRSSGERRPAALGGHLCKRECQAGVETEATYLARNDH